MWSRFVFFLLCCVAAVSCFSENDKVVGQVKNSGSQVPIGIGGEALSKNGPQTFPNTQGTSNFERHENQGTNSNVNNEGSTFGRPVGESNHNFNNRESGFPGRPTGEFGQSSNNQHSTGSKPNNQQTGGSDTINREGENRPSGSRPSGSGEDFSRPIGGSNYNTNHREGENRPSGSRPSNIGEDFSRPISGSNHNTHHKEGENRPSGSRPSSSGEDFSRPIGGSNYNTNHKEGENRPSGSRPSNIGEDFSRPISGSSQNTNHREGENRPSASRPSNTGEDFGRPTGDSGHREGESGSRPSQTGDHSFGGITDHREGEKRPFGKPGESNHQTGFKPDNQEHAFGGKPDSHQNQFSNGPSTENISNNATNHERPDKEEEEDICFTHLGCFKMGKPWKTALRPIGTPHGPEKIQTTIHFYSRENLEKPKYITLYPDVNMGEARFDPSKITAMMVHGFSNSGNATWLKDMKNVYLKKVDANILIVDWGKGAQLFNYFQVAGNTRVVGKQLGVFVKFLIEKFRADPGKFHLIGHSLGAQICSYVGKEVQGIARLTALDPAQPAFEGFDKEVRLDKNDAEFVDVVHTDAKPFIPTLGFGMITPHGHVDFYMNGGFDQPGCVPPSKKELPTVKNVLDLAKFPVEVFAKLVACPHARAYEYLTEAFNETENCIFWGHKADAKNVFKSVTNTLTQGLLKKFTALSTTCSKEDCIPLGFATKKSPLRGVFVVTTSGRPPFCISEQGVPPETAPEERKHESFIQKIGKKTKVIN